jgi:hypothetical protein
MKTTEEARTKPIWLAWSITVGEVILLLAFAIVLSQYWLMLPVWMRSSAGFCLGLAFLAVALRFFTFQRAKKRFSREIAVRKNVDCLATFPADHQ